MLATSVSNALVIGVIRVPAECSVTAGIGSVIDGIAAGNGRGGAAEIRNKFNQNKF